MKRPHSAVNIQLSAIALELFGDYPGHFRQHLSERNYAVATIAKYLSCVDMLAQMMKAEGVSIRDLDEARAADLIERTGWIPRRRIYAAFIVRRFVRFLNERGAGKLPPPPTPKEIARAELKRDYETYLLILGEGIGLVLAGVALGLVGASVVTRLLGSFLFGVTATDTATFIIVPILLTGIALAASYLPAQRALRIDPARTLYSD